MEKIINLNNNEHWCFLQRLFSKIKNNKIELILDAGSGKTSLSSLLLFFNKSFIDAVIFPGDERKKNPIELEISSDRYKLIEKDLCKDDVKKEYDLVLAHLLLGESIKWGNEFEKLCEGLLDIKSEYYIIVDFVEDNIVDYNFLEQYLLNKNLKIIHKETLSKEAPQKFNNFIGKTYVGYVIKGTINYT